jgi:hypothetical protein
VLQVSSVDHGVDAYQAVTNLGRAMSLAGGRYAVVNAARESRAGHTDGLRPGTEHFSAILFAGEWAMEPQLRSSHRRLSLMNPLGQSPSQIARCQRLKNNQTTTLQLFDHGGNG